ncbi:MAG: helix-turn-helix domain-containing protein [Candidatus Scalindua sp.]|nr:helix-turn-helix domain-containing protein [Candidatus Scalindua sp.]
MKTKSNKKCESIPPRYVGRNTVAQYTSLAESTIYEWAAQGKIPSIKIGRRVLFDLEDIDRLMSSLKRTNNQEDKIVNKIIGDLHDKAI